MKQAQDCRRNEASTELSLTINKAVILSLSKGKANATSPTTTEIYRLHCVSLEMTTGCVSHSIIKAILKEA